MSIFDSVASFGSGILDIVSNKQQNKARKGVNLAPFYADPNFAETQKTLKDLGTGILSGNLPDYYKPVGDYGSKQFEDVLGLTKRDIMTSATESLAKQGRTRGGALAASTARAISDASIKSRYEDFSRAMGNRMNLLGTGINTVSGVRGAALDDQGARNSYNMGKYDREYQSMKYGNELVGNQYAAGGSMLASLSKIIQDAGAMMGGGLSGQSKILGFNTANYR